MIHFFDFKEKNYFRAFFLPSLVTAISATIAVEFSFIRKSIDEGKKFALSYHFKECCFTFISTFLTCFFSFYGIHLATGFGNSMLHTKASILSYNV